MIDAEYIKLNSSIQTASNSQGGLIHDAEGNVEAKIELQLPGNLFSSDRARKIDKVEMLPTKMKVSMENTPLAAVPYDEERSKLTGAVVTSCQMGVYPYIMTDEGYLMPDPLGDTVFPYYHTHNMCIQFYLVRTPSSTGQGAPFAAFYLNAFDEPYFPPNDDDSAAFYERMKTTNLWTQVHQMMNLCVPTQHEKIEISGDNKVYIRNLSTLEQMFQNALQNAMTYASTRFGDPNGPVTCPSGHEMVETTLGDLRSASIVSPSAFSCPLCRVYYSENSDVMYYCQETEHYIICKNCYDRQPATLIRVLIVPKSIDRTNWANVSPPVQWDTIFTTQYGGEYCLWKMINYLDGQPSSSSTVEDLSYAIKPEVGFEDQSLTISYDSAPFKKLVPLLGSSSFAEMYDTPKQMQLNTLLRELWNAPMPKRLYKYGVVDKEDSYNFTLLNEVSCGIMSIIANQAMRDTFSFLPWLKIDKTLPEYSRTETKHNYNITVEDRTVHRTTTVITYPLRFSGNSHGIITFCTGAYVEFEGTTDPIELADVITYEYDADTTDAAAEDRTNQIVTWGVHSEDTRVPPPYEEDFHYQPTRTVTHSETETTEISSKIVTGYEEIGTTQLTNNTDWYNDSYNTTVVPTRPNMTKIGICTNCTIMGKENDTPKPTQISRYIGDNGGTWSTNATYTCSKYIPDIGYSVRIVAGTEAPYHISEKWFLMAPSAQPGETIYCIMKIYEVRPGITQIHDVYFNFAEVTEVTEEHLTNRYRVITEIDPTIINLSNRVYPNLDLPSDEHNFYMLDATSCDVEISQQEVLAGKKNAQYIVEETVYERPQHQTLIKYYVGNPDNMVSNGMETEVLNTYKATPGTRNVPWHDYDSYTPWELMDMWPYLAFDVEGSHFYMWTHEGGEPWEHIEWKSSVKIRDGSYYKWYPNQFLLEERIGGIYEFDHSKAQESQPLWNKLNEIFDSQSEGIDGVHVYYAKFYTPDETVISIQTTSAFPANLNDNPLVPIDQIWSDDIDPGDYTSTHYRQVSHREFETNDSQYSPGETTTTEEGETTTTYTQSLNSDTFWYFCTEMQNVGTQENPEYRGEWKLGKRYRYRDGDTWGFVWAPSQPYFERRFFYDKQKNYTSRITTWAIINHEDLLWDTSNPVVANTASFQIANGNRHGNAETHYNFARTITKTVTKVTEAPYEYDGNVRITFTWPNLPMVVMSPIQSIVLTMNGLQITQEYQPINMEKTGGASLTTVIPVIENYYSLATNLRDLHDELVIIKEDYDNAARYMLSDTAGSERTITFYAKYITKDGKLHQIYIPPAGVFSLQLTFKVSFFSSN